MWQRRSEATEDETGEMVCMCQGLDDSLRHLENNNDLTRFFEGTNAHLSVWAGAQGLLGGIRSPALCSSFQALTL